MNADQGAAVGYFAPPDAVVRTACPAGIGVSRADEDQYRWRVRMAERIAFHCGTQKWGIRGVYLIDASDGGEVDPGDPIRMVLHFVGSGRQRKELETWLQGWSLSLAEMNYYRTGFHSDGLLDVTFLTDEKVRDPKDVAERLKIGSDVVRPLPLGPQASE
jgi:pyruvate,water dikinase